MTFKKGDPRPEGAGRKKGQLSKINADLADRVREHVFKHAGIKDYCPVQAMAQIANDPEQDMALRMKAHSEVAQYMLPKRRAIELTGKDGNEIEVKVGLVDKLVEALARR